MPIVDSAARGTQATIWLSPTVLSSALPPHKLSAARSNVMLSTATASRAAALRPALSFAVRRVALPSSPSDMRVGDAWRETRSFTADDVAAFAELTHDPNPMHSDAEFASDSRFGGRVVHVHESGADASWSPASCCWRFRQGICAAQESRCTRHRQAMA